MKVNKRKKIMLIILLFIGLFAFYTNAYALDIKQYHVIIEDDANLLTEEEKQKLEEEMRPLNKYGHIIFKSTNENEKDTKEYVEEYYHNKFQNDSGTIFLFDMQNRYIYLFSDGENSNIITESTAQNIIDSVAEYAKNEKYYECASNTYMQIKIALTDKTGEKKEPIEETKNDYKIVIEDDANLLTNEEVENLKEKMKSLTKYGNIAFKSILTNSTSAPNYAREYYHNKFGIQSGTLFLIDMDNRKIYIFSDGTNYNIITNGKAEIITDNIYTYASNKDYYNCAYNAYDQIETLLEGGKILEPMRYISNVVVSIVVAFFTSFLIVLQNTKIKKAKANKVLQNCDINVAASNIYGQKTGTHRVYSPVESSSGGSSGGGGGGGSSGGGGGHSF